VLFLEKHIERLAEKALNQTLVKEDVQDLFAEELVDILDKRMKPERVEGLLSFEATYKATGELGKACIKLLGLVNRSWFFEDPAMGFLTPTIPLVYANQNYKRGFNNRNYAEWDNPINFKAKLVYNQLGLGHALAEAYVYRTEPLLEDIIKARRSNLGIFEAATESGCGTYVQYILEAQLKEAKPSHREHTMILNINDWDNIPEDMCE